MKNIKSLSILLLLVYHSVFIHSQSRWSSSKYNYSIEIPNGFSKVSPISSNVDFKATQGFNSIVIIVKTIPNAYSSISIWDIIGDTELYGGNFERGAREYMNNPKFLKLGKTTLSNIPTFWVDYTTDSPKSYTKTYQTKKENKIYTITLTCLYSDFNYYSAVWFRFKDKVKIE